ncbi:MAG: YiiX/YebB-like N1pC/P60 family cysteine hydrolase [Crocinitomicaceae bacterium]
MNQLYFLQLFICLIFYACVPDQDGIAGKPVHASTAYPALPDSISNLLKNGDIILRKGNGPLSFHLSRTTGENYTHCGIIFKKNGEFGVIHALGSDASYNKTDGIQIQKLSGFVKQSADSCLFICRPIFKSEIGDSIVIAAKKYLAKKIPFDYGFSLLTKDKFYCSELLYYVFKDVNDNKNVFNIIKKNKSYLLMFSTFFDENKFLPIFKFRTH